MNNSLLIAKKIKDSIFIRTPKNGKLLGVCYDSREVKKDFAFFVFKGIHTDGALYISSAIEKGASLIVTEEKPTTIIEGVGYLIVPSSRSAFAFFCASFYDFPSKKLKIIGITGTDGKTTTSTYLYHFLKLKGKKVGLLTTVYLDDGKGLRPSPFRQSTPEADILHPFFKECVENNIEYLVLECTSHSLSVEMDRLNSLNFFLSIITTITSEHLELHKTIDNYIDSKCNIIRKLEPGGYFITTTQNPHYRKCCNIAKDHPTFVIKKDLNYRIKNKKDFSSIDLIYQDKVYNTNLNVKVLLSDVILSAKAAQIITGYPITDFFENLNNLPLIKGRFNIIHNPFKFWTIVDFAHTADAFYQVMSEMKQKKGRLIALFGCGGERDTFKRSEMGKIAATFCKIIILSEEDSRGEKTQEITKQIEKGIREVNPLMEVFTIIDRKEAIEKAISIAKDNDIILFLGKGHETTIERENGKIPWNECQVIKDCLIERENKS